MRAAGCPFGLPAALRMTGRVMENGLHLGLLAERVIRPANPRPQCPSARRMQGTRKPRRVLFLAHVAKIAPGCTALAVMPSGPSAGASSPKRTLKLGSCEQEGEKA